jgi:hypothetical protein
MKKKKNLGNGFFAERHSKVLGRGNVSTVRNWMRAIMNAI